MSAVHTLLGLTRDGWAGKAWRPALSRPFVAEPSDNPTVELHLATTGWRLHPVAAVSGTVNDTRGGDARAIDDDSAT